MSAESASQHGNSEDLPPVRNRGTINTAGKKNNPSKGDCDRPSKERIKGSDYQSWDKFDADAEIEKIDKNSKDEDIKLAAEKLAKSRSVGFKDRINTDGMSDRERELVANREKDKGNEAFRAGDYKEAIHFYSRSLSVVPSAPAFNNRSLARIKLGEYVGATEDCTKVLELEPSNIKALLRRGSARKSLKQYELASHDLQEVLQAEPNNKQALDLVNDVVNKMEKEKSQIEAELKKKRASAGTGSSIDPRQKNELQNGSSRQTRGGRRLLIREVEEDESDDDDEGVQEGDHPRGLIEEKQRENAVPTTRDGKEAKLEIGSKDEARGESAVGEDSSARDGNGMTESDGCIGSKPRTPKSTTANAVSAEKGATASNKSPTGTTEDPQVPGKGQTERVAPTTPKPVPPLPKAVVSLKDAGIDFYRKGQYGDASERYSEAITLLSKDKETYPMALAALYSNRASCKLRSGHTKLCVKDCDAALALNPNSVKTYIKRADAYETMEKYGHAYVNFKTAMNYDFYNTIAQNGASRMSAILKDVHGPIWKEKLPSQPKSPSIPFSLYSKPGIDPSTMTPIPAAVPTTGTSPIQTSTNTNPHAAPSPPRAVASPPPISEADAPWKPTKPEPPAEHAAHASSDENPVSTSPAAAKVGTPLRGTPSSPSSKSSSKSSGPNNKVKMETQEKRFQTFKAQGNDHVKMGNFSQAVGCYTRCIDVDPGQAVGYTNRALCYLKLSLPKDAIEDCNKALESDPTSIKALYRRAQAKRMLSSYMESAKDLSELLKIEPNNASAKKELDLVKDAWRKELRAKQKEEAAPRVETGEKAKNQSGKRVNIQEVNESSEEETDAKTEASAASSGNKEVTSRPTRVNETKDRSASNPAAESGGMVTGAGKKDKEQRDIKEKQRSSETGGVPKGKKMSAYEFMQAWTALKKRKNLESYAALLRRLQPNEVPKVLSNKLDGDMLGKILSVSANHLVEEDPAFTFQLLNKLRGVERFKTITMFLTKMDKDNMRRCVNRISSKPEICKEEELKKLKKAYNL